MAKQIKRFEIIIRGDKDGPNKAFVQYIMEDSENPELQSRGKRLDLEIPDINKTMHGQKVEGEVWTDAMAAVKTAESIS